MDSFSTSGPLSAYRAALERGELRPDASQMQVAEKLEDLYRALCAKAVRKPLAGLFKKFRRQDLPSGIYIHGAIGRGKSMLMDLFFRAVPLEQKRRVHFHQFMQEVHSRIHTWRKMTPAQRKQEMGEGGLDDPIPPLAEKIARETRLLCFDEFQVLDVADAMILGKLYKNLISRGVVIVSTSNRAPKELYKGGLNRELFLPFIRMIEEEMEVVELTGSLDYRYQRLKGLPTYLTPVNERTTESLRKAFWALTDRDVGDPATVPSEEIVVQGRKLFVPKAAMGAAVFSFKRLCANPYGAADYLAIAWRYHTVFIVAIPKLTRAQRNQAKRFVTLIDVLYENHVKLFASAAAKPEKLYPKGDGSFEFSRTVSRLYEMQSKEYLEKGHAV